MEYLYVFGFFVPIAIAFGAGFLLGRVHERNAAEKVYPAEPGPLKFTRMLENFDDDLYPPPIGSEEWDEWVGKQNRKARKQGT